MEGVTAAGGHFHLHQLLQAVVPPFQLSIRLHPRRLGGLHRPEGYWNLKDQQQQVDITWEENSQKQLLSYPQLHLQKHGLQACNVIGEIRAWLLPHA